MNRLADLASQFAIKYAEEPSPETKPEGIRKVKEPRSHRDYINDKLRETIAPYIDWVGDHAIYEKGDNWQNKEWVMDIDFMNIPEDPQAKKLNHSEFYYYLLDLVKELKAAFPSAHINMHDSDLKGPRGMLVKLIRVSEPFGAPYNP